MSEDDRNRGKRRRKRKRRRKGGPPEGAQGSSAEAPRGSEGGGGRPRRKKRRRRREDDSAQDAPTPPPTPSFIRAHTEPEPAPAGEEYGDDEAGPSTPSAEVAWGDDADAPTPEIALEADLPPDPPADDPDPASAHLEEEDAGETVPEELRGGPAVRSVVGVKFASAGKIYLYDGGEDVYRRGEEVVVESDRGMRVGEVAVPSARRARSRSSLKRILRRPTRNDRRALERNEERARETLRVAKEKARDLGLEVKVFRAVHALSGNKVQIYFSAENKVDHRTFARELAHELRCRVDMRQVGVRDEAKMVGGIGSCGGELCCTTWLPNFVPVSIKNAKDQGLSLNPAKVSGQCGRLKCCLVYEQATYAELRKGLPKLGKRVVTDAGEGRVVEVDVLHQRIRVRLTEGEFRVFSAGEVEPMFPPQNQNKS